MNMIHILVLFSWSQAVPVDLKGTSPVQSDQLPMKGFPSHGWSPKSSRPVVMDDQDIGLNQKNAGLGITKWGYPPVDGVIVWLSDSQRSQKGKKWPRNFKLLLECSRWTKRATEGGAEKFLKDPLKTGIWIIWGSSYVLGAWKISSNETRCVFVETKQCVAGASRRIFGKITIVGWN